VATHVKVIAALFIVCGSMLLAGALFLPLILGLVATVVGASHDPDAAVATTVLGFTGAALSVFFAVLAAPFFATGWGLLKLRPWARIAGIVLGALSLTSFPFGTVIGIYALVILFRKETEALFVPQIQGQTMKQ
jgi:hypothetical protein